jgi:Tfp pilus assembly protein PilN
MLRINLLPKEVLERRRYEGWYRWVFILAVGLILIVLGIYVLLMLEVSAKNGQLQQIQESSQKYAQDAEQLSIFQKKETELQARQTVAQLALANRINTGQVANDVSLVLPDEVWLGLFEISETTGVTLNAHTPRSASEASDVSYKSIATTLVRLNQLPDIYDVWLTSSANNVFTKFDPPVVSSGTPGSDPKVVDFTVTAKISPPANSAPSTGSPAAQ